MHTNPWQVFDDNGEAITGHGIDASGFERGAQLVMANAHVWLWRIGQGLDVEVLLQKRSQSVQRSPGYYHASASGHVDLGETPIIAAIRETNEELSLKLNADDLFFVRSSRAGKRFESINTVFLVKMYHDYNFIFDDGEVELVEWISLKKFKDMIESPEKFKLVDQGAAYYTELLNALFWQLDENH